MGIGGGTISGITGAAVIVAVQGAAVTGAVKMLAAVTGAVELLPVELLLPPTHKPLYRVRASFFAPPPPRPTCATPSRSPRPKMATSRKSPKRWTA